MSVETPTLDGNWQMTGLPAGEIVVLFMLVQINANLVSGDLDIANDSQQSFNVTGNNNYPGVLLDFNSGSQLAFTFTGSFTDDDTVTGTLSGQFNGPSTLTRSE